MQPVPTLPSRATCKAKDCPKIDAMRLAALVVVVICGTLILIFAAIDGVTVKEVVVIIGAAAWGIRIDRGQYVTATKIDDNTERTDLGLAKTEAVSVQLEDARNDVACRVDKVEKLANGLSTARAEEARAAGVAIGQATLIAAVADVAPQLAPNVAAKAADLAVGATKEKLADAFQAGVEKGRSDSNPG